jgi:hypothetical protein
LKIELHDDLSSIRFAEITLNQEQTCQALSRLAYTTCDCEVFNLENVGKKQVIKVIEFEMPKCDYKSRDKIAYKLAQQVAGEGWIASEYFGAQGSYFNRNGKEYATTRAYRWEDVK